MEAEFFPNLVKLIAELVIIHLEYIVLIYFVWYKRSSKLLEKFQESPGKVLEFHIQLTVATQLLLPLYTEYMNFEFLKHIIYSNYMFNIIQATCS